MDEKHIVGHLAGRPHHSRRRTDGIIGRLTYTPASGDEGLGELRRNRVKDETPHFKQVTPVSTWCPPARFNTSHLSDGPPWRVARQQENWLLEYLPEASIDEEDLETLLLEEIANSQADSKPSVAETALLFSTGEIMDVRDWFKGLKKHTVLAVASGDSGNILRLVSLSREEWQWDAAGVRVQTHIPNHRLEGEWSEDGVPITLIRFAQDSKKDDPVRWLLVQRGTATTIYEPEVRTMPMQAKEVVRKDSQQGSHPSQIYANPLFTIPMSRTGGSLQSDVSFNRSEKGIPQLAIVDQCGYWSIWDIVGNIRGRAKVLTPVLKLCGNSLLGGIPKLPSNPANDRKPYQMIFLTFGADKNQKNSNRQRLPSQSPSPVPGSEKRLLMLSSGKLLQLYDFSSETLHPVAGTVLAKDNQEILGIAPSRLNSSQAFILTTTNILWVAVKESRIKAKSKSSSFSLTLEVLVSCPHQKDSTDPTLRLDVSGGTYVNNTAACFACIWSTKDTELTIVWFLTPESGPVRYQRELVSIKTPTNFVGLSMMPVGRMIGGDEPTSTAGKAMRDAQLRFFQFLMLGQDLDVQSALCVWSNQAGVEVPLPDQKVGVQKDRGESEKLEESLENVFTVPDWFDERVALGDLEPEETGAGECKRREPRIKNAVVLAQRLFCAEEASRMDNDEDAVMNSANDFSFDFIHETVEREAKDGYMPNHSLMELIKLARPRMEMLDLARRYANEEPEPQPYTENWFYTPESNRPVPGFNPDDMATNIRNLFPRPKRCDSTYKQHRKKITQQIAAQLFLSNIGITSVPREWVTTAASVSQSQPPQSQFSSSLPFASTPRSPVKGLSQSLYSSQLDISAKASTSSSQPVEAISTALHLRQYVTTQSTLSSDPQLDLTPWELGTDPDNITWRPGQDLEAEDLIDRRRRKFEARRKRNERLSQALFGEDSILDSGHEPATIQPSSQLVFSQQALGSPTFLRSPVRKVREGSPLRREYLRGDEKSQSQSQGGFGGGTPSQKSLFGFGGKKRDSLGLGGLPKKSDPMGGGKLSPFKKRKSGGRLSGARLSGFR